MRATDQQQNIWAFTETMVLVCPHCGAPAWSRRQETPAAASAAAGIFTDRRVTCTRCAFSKNWTGNATFAFSQREPVSDGYFELPLYLQTACCNDTLWVYNPSHLQLLQNWLSADLRQRQADPNWGWANQSYFPRLPKWLKSAKNRPAIATALAKLQLLASKLASSGQ